MFRISRDFFQFFRGLVDEYGDVVGFRMGKQPFVVVNHPDLIRDVLVTQQRCFAKGRALERMRRLLGNGLLTSEGEFHLRQRRLAQPAFHRDRVAGYATSMIHYAGRWRDRWEDGSTVDMHEEMMRLTLAVVGKTLFDADVEAESHEIGDALGYVLNSFSVSMLPYAELLEKLPLPSTRKFARARNRLDETIYRMIDDRRASGDDRGDLLSMLMQASDTEGDGSGMSNEQLRDEALTIFLAGHETTANAMTWTWYLLSQHPNVVARLHAEVDALGGEPVAADVMRLPYARQVVAESMRLYPPAYAIGRRALVACDIGTFTIPPRTIVLTSPYLQHHDARWFPEPEHFDPDRWTVERIAERPKFSYFPFGAGTRICIGEQFAWTEAILLLATLAQRWAPTLVPGHPVRLQPRITLRPKDGMRMILHKRVLTASS